MNGIAEEDERYIPSETVSALLPITDTNVSDGCVGPMATTPVTRSGYRAPSSITARPPIEWPTATALETFSESSTPMASCAILGIETGSLV